jgi:antitoxin (DNA-binding transcriptional repressor) of toxin-antitoxin stability system
MNAIPVGQLKTNFSTILERVKRGEKVVISFGKKKEKVAVIVPFKEDKPQKSRKLGLLKGKAKCLFKEDFQISDEELLLL